MLANIQGHNDGLGSVLMFMRQFWQLFSVVSILFYSDFASAGYCLEDWACWEVRETNGRYEFWVKNQKSHSFTATLDVKTKNLRSLKKNKNRYSETIVVPGHSERVLLTLYPIQDGKDVSYRDVFYWMPGVMDADHNDDVIYQLPFAEGEQYPLVQGFGGGWSHRGGSKYAVDFAMPVGTPVHAARNGFVVQTVAHHNRGGASRRYAEYANYVVVLHDDGTTGEYHHLMQDGVAVNVGDSVESGDLLGFSGNTGFSSIPHLHFAVYRPKPFGEFESIQFRFADGVSTSRRR
jgi:murein DD-endopeptidase MepM/ murein hydrolase activator NlpD